MSELRTSELKNPIMSSVVVAGVGGGPMYGLDHKSSLRKLSFPSCGAEALTRLHRQCLTFARKQSSPKEMEVRCYL